MRISTLTAVVVALALTGSAWAQCNSGTKKVAQGKAGCSATCSSAKMASGCQSSCSSAKLASAKGNCCGQCGGSKACDPADCWTKCGPKMQFSVAGETLCCPKNAEILAKANHDTIKYVVAGQTFENKGEAMTALVKVMHERLNEMTTVTYVVGDQEMQCGMSASKMAKAHGTDVRYRVASIVFTDKSQAEKAAQLARDAANNVKMVTVVDGKEYCCSKTAAKVASDCGKPCEYKVAGEKDSTCCKTTAEMRLTQAKVQAAIKAMQQSSAGS